MKTLKIDQKNFKEVVRILIKAIQKGEVVVSPTDTVYGLICDAINKTAVKKLFQIKKRSIRKPIPIFVRDIKMARNLTYLEKNQEKSLKKIWPGKVTVVLKAKKKFPKGVLSTENKIGLRIPNYRLINILLKKLSRPLTATSANISGELPSTKIEKVVNQFKKRKLQPDLIINAGNLKPSKPSTVVDLTGPKFKILRVGDIKKDKLLKLFQ